MGKKQVAQTAPSEKEKAAEPSHAAEAASSVQTGPETPAIQTPAVPPSQAGTSQTPAQLYSIPLDAVMKFLQTLSPGLDFTATLTQITTPTQTSPASQKQPVLSLQPLPQKEEKSNESEIVVETEEMLDNGERELKAEDGEESKLVDGISEELNVLGTESDTERVSEEGQGHDNVGKEEGDLVIGYTKDTTLGDESWESAITVPEATPQVMIEKRFLAVLPRFTGGEGSEPWGTLNKFQTMCWK